MSLLAHFCIIFWFTKIIFYVVFLEHFLGWLRMVVLFYSTSLSRGATTNFAWHLAGSRDEYILGISMGPMGPMEIPMGMGIAKRVSWERKWEWE